MKTDIAVIGGGAAGISAAISAKQCFPELSITIVERLDRIGKKILATGSGRCNLSNENLTADAYHGSLNAMQIIKKTSSAKDFFKGIGLLCVTDEQGRMYPYSESAASVLNALRLRCNELGINIVCGFEMTDISHIKNGYMIQGSSDKIECSRIIIAAGGYASPNFGTDGKIIAMLRKSGYKTAKICPAVAPLRVSAENVKGLKGIRVKGSVSAVSGNRILRTESGEIQFTENSVSGICVFNLAYLMAEYEGKLTIRADLAPNMSVNQLTDYLYSVRSIRKSFAAEELLTGMFTRNLAVYLVKKTLCRPLTGKIADVNNREIKHLAQIIKALDFPVTGVSSWQKAQATAGGIHKSCVDDSLCSVSDRGVYFAGEILDVNGDCGGYNLQWAWSSGLWAGKRCAESMKGEKLIDKNK